MHFFFAIQVHAQKTARFPIAIFDTSFPFHELCVIADGTRFFWEEEEATKALSLITVRMIAWYRGMHGEMPLTKSHSIFNALIMNMTMFIGRNSNNTSMGSSVSVKAPDIISNST